MQAEPLEAETPSRSRAMSIVSESVPVKLTFKVLARRALMDPFCSTTGQVVDSPCQS